MNIAYLILAHKLPKQLIRLINALNCENVYFFIHFNKKSSNDMFNQVFNTFKGLNNVYFINRLNCSWADFNIVQATIEGIKTINNTNLSLDYIIFLSGQDYPIKTNTYIKDFLIANKGKCFIPHFPLPRPGWHNGSFNKVPKQYKLPSNISLYGGSTWWGLSKECIEYINDFVIKNPGYIEYCKHLISSSEIFFQTIVLNSYFKNNVINKGLVYVDWDVPYPYYHPATLSKKYFSILSKSQSLFARKFDIELDSKILDMIDKNLLRGRKKSD